MRRIDTRNEWADLGVRHAGCMVGEVSLPLEEAVEVSGGCSSYFHLCSQNGVRNLAQENSNRSVLKYLVVVVGFLQHFYNSQVFSFLLMEATIWGVWVGGCIFFSQKGCAKFF